MNNLVSGINIYQCRQKRYIIVGMNTIELDLASTIPLANKSTIINKTPI